LETQLDAAARAALATAHFDADGRPVLYLSRKVAWLSMNLADVAPFLPATVRTSANSMTNGSWLAGPASSRKPPPFRTTFMPFDYACQAPRILDHDDALKALDAYAAREAASDDYFATSTSAAPPSSSS